MSDAENQTEMFGDDDLDHAAIIANLGALEPEDPERLPKRLVELTEVIAATLIHKHEVTKDRAHKMGLSIAAGIARYFGGDRFYLPSGNKLDLMLRDKAIWDEFRGHNHQQLARKYKLTVVQIYNVLNKQKALHQSKIQIPLFSEQKS